MMTSPPKPWEKADHGQSGELALSSGPAENVNALTTRPVEGQLQQRMADADEEGALVRSGMGGALGHSYGAT
jgi:hypothetical protein